MCDKICFKDAFLFRKFRIKENVFNEFIASALAKW